MLRYGSVCSGVEAATLAWHQLGWKPEFFAEVEPFPSAVLKERFGASLPSCPLNPEELLDGQGAVLKGKEKEYAERVYWKRTFDKMRRQENTDWTIPNFGDMTKIGILDDGRCFAGGLSCENPIDLLVGGTPCFAKGTVVLTKDGYREISTIKAGDFVVTDQWKLKKVLKTGSKFAQVYPLRLDRGHEFLVTSNHPFLSFRKIFGKHDLDYRSIRECGDFGHLVVMPNVDAVSDCLDSKKEFDLKETDLYHLCGWFLRAGFLEKDEVRLMVGKKEDLFRKEFSRIFGENGDLEFKSPFCSIKKKSVSDFIKENFLQGKEATSKKVPLWCYHRDIAKEVVAGIRMSGEGNSLVYRNTRGVGLPIAYGIADLASCKVCHFGEDVCVLLDKPAERFCFSEEKIVSEIMLLPQHWETMVYNLEVEGDHTYVANGTFVHNCQSYSLAGKREGNRGVSGLSLDYIRLARDPHSKCRWVVWENVPGALSSTNGLDFAAFLSGICGHDVAVPERGWRNAGICEGRNGGFGVAWRVLDAQYVRTPRFPRAIPQRRRRIFLVGYRSLPVGNPLDWQCAATVLFDGESMSGNAPSRRREKKTAPENLGSRSPETDEGLGVNEKTVLSIGNGQLHEALSIQTEVMNTLHCMHDVERIAIVGDDDNEKCLEGMVYENHANDKRVTGPYNVCPTLTSRMGTGGGNVPLTQMVERCAAFKAGNGPKARSLGYEEEISPTLTSVQSGGNGTPTIVCFTQNQRNEVRLIGGDGQVSGGVMAQPGMKNNNYICELSHDEESVNSNGESVMPAICASEYKGVQNQKDHSGGYVIDKTNEKKKNGLSVRKLMPIETERLMGFPDNHTAIPWNGKSADECPDSPRYKACGNSFCVNCIEWIGRRIEMVEKSINSI